MVSSEWLDEERNWDTLGDEPLYVGDTWEEPLDFTDEITGDPIDLTGRTFVASIRVRPSAADVTMAYLVDTTGLAAGTIVLKAATPTGAIVPGFYYRDLQETITATGRVETLLRGRVRVSRDVSRS